MTGLESMTRCSMIGNIGEPLALTLPAMNRLKQIRSAVRHALALVIFVLVSSAAFAQAADPLLSWNDGQAKQSILNFVAAVTREGSPDFVPPARRIATFDNDGTLWCEQPMYVQLAFALARTKVLAPLNPDWTTKQPFKAVLDNDLKTVMASGERGLMEI